MKKTYVTTMPDHVTHERQDLFSLAESVAEPVRVLSEAQENAAGLIAGRALAVGQSRRGPASAGRRFLPRMAGFRMQMPSAPQSNKAGLNRKAVHLGDFAVFAEVVDWRQ